jgi:hypothetical protein
VIALDEATCAFHPRWPGQPSTAVWSFPGILVAGRSAAETSEMMFQSLY